MKDSKLGDTLRAKGDKFNLKQGPNNDLERHELQKIPYVSKVGSLMYAQVCTRLNIAFVVEVLGKYLSDLGMQQWKAIKCVMHYLKSTKGYVFTYRKSSDTLILVLLDTKIANTPRFDMFICSLLKSVKQTLIAPSTMTAEFIACFEALNHEIWL
ncbi:hypothetical protein CR513_23284, partial [Mucuna pruriens]